MFCELKNALLHCKLKVLFLCCILLSTDKIKSNHSRVIGAIRGLKGPNHTNNIDSISESACQRREDTAVYFVDL